MKHDDNCAYHQDQNEWECNCGAYVHRAHALVKAVGEITPVALDNEPAAQFSTPTAQVNAEMLAALREIADRLEQGHDPTMSTDVNWGGMFNDIRACREQARSIIARAEQMQGDQWRRDAR